MRTKTISFVLFLNLLLLSQGVIFAQAENPKTYIVEKEDFLKFPKEKGITEFYGGYQFLLDGAGNIYILDTKYSYILKFSNDGKFLQKIGRAGEGPGEFTPFFIASVLKDGSLYVNLRRGDLDLRQFDKKGNYIKNFLYSNDSYGIDEFSFLDDKIFACSVIVGEGYDCLFEKAIVNIETKEVKIISSKLDPRPAKLGFFTPVVPDNDGNFYFTINSYSDYKVFKFGKEGKLLNTITREKKQTRLRGKKLTEYEKDIEKNEEKIKEAYRSLGKTYKKNDDPPTYPMIKCLATDSKNNLWVFTSEKSNENIMSIDLYNSKGDFLKSFYFQNEELGAISNLKVRIFKDYLYCWVRDKIGFEHIYRYKIPKEIYVK